MAETCAMKAFGGWDRVEHERARFIGAGDEVEHLVASWLHGQRCHHERGRTRYCHRMRLAVVSEVRTGQEHAIR
ncbi:hypothetical protein [Pyxidicoccus xibeiensis]|uniref:hypothetical protein n=1 Tax=Pyxidicoccus xibeiensis TaxID=2906759 RepID=UPI0020A7A628|nr:hypothetical protein [Pyxidicoccus xibeiensis]MCP3137134.1 hypothetical protein [Pyxidicoccus xibeiensis]